MTPNEKAEKIYSELDFGCGCCTNTTSADQIKIIAAALTEYGEAEWKRGCQEGSARIIFDQGYARGIEESAKALIEDASVADKETKRIAKVWATMIRALAREK